MRYLPELERYIAVAERTFGRLASVVTTIVFVVFNFSCSKYQHVDPPPVIKKTIEIPQEWLGITSYLTINKDKNMVIYSTKEEGYHISFRLDTIHTPKLAQVYPHLIYESIDSLPTYGWTQGIPLKSLCSSDPDSLLMPKFSQSLNGELYWLNDKRNEIWQGKTITEWIQVRERYYDHFIDRHVEIGSYGRVVGFQMDTIVFRTGKEIIDYSVPMINTFENYGGNKSIAILRNDTLQNLYSTDWQSPPKLLFSPFDYSNFRNSSYGIRVSDAGVHIGTYGKKARNSQGSSFLNEYLLEGNYDTAMPLDIYEDDLHLFVISDNLPSILVLNPSGFN